MSVPLTEARVGNLYRCKITDSAGNVVYSEPGEICTSAVIISHPKDSAAAYGERATFTVEAAGDGLTYQWQSSVDGTSWGNSSAAGNATASMWVNVAEYNINYLYRCKVTDSAGNVVYSNPAAVKTGQVTWKNTYNADGLRTKRTDGYTTYTYYYTGDKLTYMTVGDDTLRFSYSANGTPLTVQLNSTRYFYITNQQGDVEAIVSVGGYVKVKYAYDAWGNIISVTGSMADTLGKINPLRYRGYIYDAETELYYLQSRYYDPEVGRFINADAFPSTGQGLVGNNMFAYCNNNPVNRRDSEGTTPETIWDLISLGSSIIDVVLNPSDPWAWVGLVGDLIDVVVPFVGGIGEATRALNAALDVADALDDAHDASKFIDDVADAAVKCDGLCFVAGTEILIKDGATAIENIQVGNFVWAWDEETGDVALKEVVETYVSNTYELVYILVDGEQIITTPSHPFYTPTKGWIEAISLCAGDILTLKNGSDAEIEKVEYKFLQKPITVFNFQVEDYHTYYVGKTGILVHNSCLLDDVLDDAIETTSHNGITKNFEKLGGYDQAYSDFMHLEPSAIHPISTKYGDGLRGTLSGGSNLVLRPGSRTGGITLELQISSRNRIKIRY